MKWGLTVPVESKRIIIVSEVRRCGKSVLIRQQLIESDNALYLHYGYPRLEANSTQSFRLHFLPFLFKLPKHKEEIDQKYESH